MSNYLNPGSPRVSSVEDMARSLGLPQSWVDETHASIKRGVAAAVNAGRSTPWDQVEREIFGDREGGPMMEGDDQAGRGNDG